MNDANDIVVVDDNQVLVSVLSEIFKELGYTVRTASDGFEAMATIRERVPGILISDLNMPRMTGYELLSIVPRRFPTVAVIAMSGAYRGNDIPAEIAADGFYAKGGCSAAQLLEILNSLGRTANDRLRAFVLRQGKHCVEPPSLSPGRQIRRTAQSVNFTRYFGIGRYVRPMASSSRFCQSCTEQSFALTSKGLSNGRHKWTERDHARDRVCRLDT